MSTFYDLPKTSLAVFQATDPTDAFRILLPALPLNLGFICHESCLAWHREMHISSEIPFVVSKFSENSDMNSEDVTSSDVIFADFDMYLLTFGVQKALRLVKSLKNKKRIFIVLTDPLPHLEHLMNTNFSIKSTEDPTIFMCSTTAFDKKGNFTISDQMITIPASGKPTFKTIKKLENSVETAITTPTTSSDPSGKGAMDLPFFVGRQEDGVAIRDAATKKIRVGGQIVYEPDRDDDLDDSDPDDDLNI